MKRIARTLASFLMLCLFASTGIARAERTVPDDRVALKGLKQARAVFDVRLSELDKLLFNLGLVKETWEGLVAQGVKPTLVVTLRGAGVKLFTKDLASEELLALVHDLQRKGIRIEICSVATRIFKVDNAQLVPEVILVGNVLTSQIAWQNKHYALITLN